MSFTKSRLYDIYNINEMGSHHFKSTCFLKLFLIAQRLNIVSYWPILEYEYCKILIFVKSWEDYCIFGVLPVILIKHSVYTLYAMIKIYSSHCNNEQLLIWYQKLQSLLCNNWWLVFLFLLGEQPHFWDFAIPDTSTP